MESLLVHPVLGVCYKIREADSLHLWLSPLTTSFPWYRSLTLKSSTTCWKQLRATRKRDKGLNVTFPATSLANWASHGIPLRVSMLPGGCRKAPQPTPYSRETTWRRGLDWTWTWQSIRGLRAIGGPCILCHKTALPSELFTSV